MKLLLCKMFKNQYFLLSPNTYGLSTWGTSRQVHLIKKKRFWYIQTWSCGNDYIDDQLYDTKLNVVKETYSIDEIIFYLFDNGIKDVNFILDDFMIICNSYIDFIKSSL